MNQTSHSISEKNVNLARLDKGRYFAFAECRMHHQLPSSIGARAIVRGTDFGRSATNRAALVRNARTAYWATDARDLSFRRYRCDDMTSLLTTDNAHLFDSVTRSENLFLFHSAPLFDIGSLANL
jgi:hypothetical protein